MKLPPPGMLDRLAGEYVLGTMRGGARRRFEHWMRDNQWLRGRVSDWERRLMPMAAWLPRESAPPGTWDRLERRLFGHGDPVIRQVGVGTTVSRWPLRLATAWAALASLSLAAVLGVLWLSPERPAAPGDATIAETGQQGLPASYLAVLSDEQGRTTLVASAPRHGRQLELKVLRPTAPPVGRQWVLWAQSAAGERTALGVVELNGRTRLDLAGTAEQRLSNAASLLISAEPDAAAPPDQPTRVAWSGPCVKTW
ncbi:anti-sigma factor [Caldimonas brevitalea]|uniref:Anti-sigma K factor RskA C-terminal domain-containing protein n=1 Tax=Caldimonas brevitalea TaxID=413882 RepID=A0A0G3BJR9_9BURK|nr:anti-sigma factor [Caldimonas brevitalea]AKJ28238.1 hypothetical protein AAW51_1547 [Caldimonas brevitalea]